MHKFTCQYTGNPEIHPCVKYADFQKYVKMTLDLNQIVTEFKTKQEEDQRTREQKVLAFRKAVSDAGNNLTTKISENNVILSAALQKFNDSTTAALIDMNDSITNALTSVISL